MLSLYGRLALPFARVLRFDATAPAMRAVAAVVPRPWSAPLRQRAALVPCVHALLLDAEGAWSWEPEDCHAAAVRHAGVHEWIEEHPGRDLRLWVSGQLLQSLGSVASASGGDDESLRSNARHALVQRHGERATQWALATWKNDLAAGVCALAGVDLDVLARHAQRHGVRMRSVVPWWYHAFLEAGRCVDALAEAESANVCIVEGRQIAWVTSTRGRLTDVRQALLESACVAALGEEIRVRTQRCTCAQSITVVVGHGLVDGARTQSLKALVLGRLDGQQPPQWLRPSLRREMH